MFPSPLTRQHTDLYQAINHDGPKKPDLETTHAATGMCALGHTQTCEHWRGIMGNAITDLKHGSLQSPPSYMDTHINKSLSVRPDSIPGPLAQSRAHLVCRAASSRRRYVRTRAHLHMNEASKQVNSSFQRVPFSPSPLKARGPVPSFPRLLSGFVRSRK